MTWWEIAPLAVLYGIAGLVSARLFAGHLAYSMAEEAGYRRWRDHGAPDGSQWLGGWCMGLVGGLIWPLIWPVLKMPVPRLAIGREAEAIRRRRDEYVSELERKAGIR